jgi:hypothetical protein
MDGFLQFQKKDLNLSNPVTIHLFIDNDQPKSSDGPSLVNEMKTEIY